MKTIQLMTVVMIVNATTAFQSLSTTNKASHIVLSSTTASSDTTTTVDPKDAVKLFGRLAEKYIMLDDSGGLCCYSACSDCEYRLPDGGYRMADQSASRPKWIPVYEERKFENLGKEHVAKWKTEIFTNGPSVTKEEFVAAIAEMDFATPLGGPFVSKSAGKMEDGSTAAAENLFEILAQGKEKLARHKMSVRLKEISEGDEGLTWPKFSKTLGIDS